MRITINRLTTRLRTRLRARPHTRWGWFVFIYSASVLGFGAVIFLLEILLPK